LWRNGMNLHRRLRNAVSREELGAPRRGTNDAEENEERERVGRMLPHPCGLLERSSFIRVVVISHAGNVRRGARRTAPGAGAVPGKPAASFRRDARCSRGRSCGWFLVCFIGPLVPSLSKSVIAWVSNGEVFRRIFMRGICERRLARTLAPPAAAESGGGRDCEVLSTPRGSHKRSKLIHRLVIATPPMFGARRTEQQPRRLRSPRKQPNGSDLDKECGCNLTCDNMSDVGDVAPTELGISWLCDLQIFRAYGAKGCCSHMSL
jgi:hypothetical protein